MPKIRTRPLAAIALSAAILAPTAAMAHPGHGLALSAGFADGLVHPWTGLNHLVSLLLAGAWAAVLGGRALLRVPVTLLLGMLAGFVAAPLAGAGVAEALAAGATISLVVMAALRVRAPLPLAMSACALFGFGHGLAHGLESTGSDAAFAAGMVAGSSLLMALGLAGAQWALRTPALSALTLPARR